MNSILSRQNHDAKLKTVCGRMLEPLTCGHCGKHESCNSTTLNSCCHALKTLGNQEPQNITNVCHVALHAKRVRILKHIASLYITTLCHCRALKTLSHLACLKTPANRDAHATQCGCKPTRNRRRVPAEAELLTRDSAMTEESGLAIGSRMGRRGQAVSLPRFAFAPPNASGTPTIGRGSSRRAGDVRRERSTG